MFFKTIDIENAHYLLGKKQDAKQYEVKFI